MSFLGGRKEKQEIKLTREQRKLFVNRVLSHNKAAFTFSRKTRFAERFVTKPDGELREPGFTPNSVYWIIEALDDEGQPYTLEQFLEDLEAENNG
jgi:hypothetical protein